jgi:carbamoyltransferase
MKTRINKAVKFREPFRPFAPIVLEEKASEYFVCDRPSPYMLFNFEVRPDKRDKIPAVTHIDGTARIQTVNSEQNRSAYDIIKAFEQLTGIPVLLNTSFNLRGHPIVRTPAEAFATFISSGVDLLVMEDCILEKSKVKIDKYPQFKIKSGTD